MGIEYKLGFILGALIGAAVWCILILIFLKLTRTDGTMKSKFDERQRIVQGKAYKYGFFILLVYNLLLGILDSGLNIRYADMGTEMVLGVLISVMVCAAYSIWNDGYFSLNENIVRVLAGFGIMALINIGLGIYNLRFGGIVENGILTIYCLNFFCGLVISVIMIIAVVKYIYNKKDEEA